MRFAFYGSTGTNPIRHRGHGITESEVNMIVWNLRISSSHSERDTEAASSFTFRKE